MHASITTGADVRCADGDAGTAGGLIINPNRNHLDYVIIDPGPLGGRAYYLPVGQLEHVSAGGLTLNCTLAELEDLPREEVWTEQGTVQDNLRDLCVVHAGTPVRTADGGLLGQFRGALIDSDFQVVAVTLDRAPNQAIPIERIARNSDDAGELIVYLAREATV